MSSLLVDIDRLATYDAEGVAPYIIGKKEISNSPYTFRQGLGTMADMEIVGGTVAWNQLAYTNDYTHSANGITVTRSAPDGNTSIVVSDSVTNYLQYQVSSIVPVLGHKYALIVDKPLENGIEFYAVSITVRGEYPAPKNQATIGNATSDSVRFYIFIGSDTPSGTYNYHFRIHDLTQMFGSTIADYIYSLEQATAGAGVAWFRKLFPADYYPYDAGSIQSVSVESRKVTGKNLMPLTVASIKAANPYDTWNGNTTTKSDGLTFTILTDDGVHVTGIKVNGTASDVRYLGLTAEYTMRTGSYVLSGGASANVRLYDNGYIASEGGNAPFTIDSDATKRWLIRVAKNAVVSNQIVYPMIRFATVSDATYEPYTSIAYPFDSTKELRGLFSLSGNELIANGDVYTAGGNIQRKYGIVDLGTLTWNYYNTSGSVFAPYFYANITGAKWNGQTDLTTQNILCSKYPNVKRSQGSFVDKTICGDGTAPTVFNQIQVKDSAYTDAATFKTAMSGVYLVYELETPTTESAKPFQNPQRAYPDGAEEFTDGLTRDVIVPVGNNTTYQLSKALIPEEDYTDGAMEILEDCIETKTDILAIAPNEPGATASQAYSAGDHFYKDGKFCTAITSISSGATFTKNTNYREESTGASSAMNNYRSKKLTATVSSTSLAFTDTLISNSATVIDGPYIADVMVGVTDATISSNTVTFTLDSSSANGKSAYIWLRY